MGKSKKYITAGLLVFILAAICCFLYPCSGVTLVSAQKQEDDDNRVLTVIMYHQLLKKGRRSAYIVTPDCFEKDLIMIKERGYQTVLPSEVIDFVYNGKPLPDKPLMITFDDGHFNNMHYGIPLLKKYGMKAVFNVVGKYSENTVNSGDVSKPAYSHFTWEQLRKIDLDKDFEVGNHTYNLHGVKGRVGIAKVSGESVGQYKKVLIDDVDKMQKIFEQECGFTPVCFAYPFGKYSKLSKELLVEYGFKMIFNCCQKNNLIVRGDKKCLHDICRFNRSAFLERDKFFDNLERV